MYSKKKKRKKKCFKITANLRYQYIVYKNVELISAYIMLQSSAERVG